MPWVYDPGHSQVTWSVKYIGLSLVHGLFRKMDAQLNLEDDDPTRWSATVTIDAASVESGIDWTLRIRRRGRRLRRLGRAVGGLNQIGAALAPRLQRLALDGEQPGMRERHRGDLAASDDHARAEPGRAPHLPSARRG